MKNTMVASVLVALGLAGGCDYRATTRAETNNRDMPLTEDLTRAPTEQPNAAVNPLVEQGGPGTFRTPPSADNHPLADSAKLSDEQIAHIAEIVDEGEMEQAKMAAERATDTQVKRFASHMLLQHTKSREQSEKVIKHENLSPTASMAAQGIEEHARKVLDSLRDTNDENFDANYMDAQVNQHQHVARLLDVTLLPGAESRELRARLEETRAMVEDHLQEARQIRSSLAASASASAHAQR